FVILSFAPLKAEAGNASNCNAVDAPLCLAKERCDRPQTDPSDPIRCGLACDQTGREASSESGETFFLVRTMVSLAGDARPPACVSAPVPCDSPAAVCRARAAARSGSRCRGAC